MGIITAGRHKKKKGSSRMQEIGYKQIQIWLDAEEAKLVVEAAREAEIKLATWVRKIAVNAAKRSS